MLPIAVALLIGNLCFQQLSDIPDNVWTWLLVPLIALFAGSPQWRWLAAVAVGFLWPLACLPPASLPYSLANQPLEVTGKITRIDKVYSRYTLISFSIEDIVDAESSWKGRVQLRWPSPSPSLGDRWRLTIDLKPFSGTANPGGFDYQRWAFAKGLQGRGHLLSADKHLSSPPDYSIDGIRQHLANRLQHSQLPWNDILAALAIGDRSRINTRQWQVFRDTGTSHLIAISGLHIGLIAAMAFWFGRRLATRIPGLAVRIPATTIAAPMAMAAAVGYALLAGLSLPTQRACVMVACVMLAIFRQRPLKPFHGFAIALTGILLIDPFSTLSPGFWLSFGAVSIILYRLAWRHPGPSVAGGWLSLQVTLSLALLPATAFFFQTMSLAGPIANLIAIPWIAAVTVPLTLSSCLLPDSLFMIPLTLASLSLEILWPFLDILSRWPVLHPATPPPWSLPLIVVGILWLLAPVGFPARLTGLLLWLPLLSVPRHPLPTDALRLTLLDVRRGLAVVIETNHDRQRKTLIVDTGPIRGYSGRRIIIPFLREYNIHSIDRLLISHNDSTHYGGTRALLEQYPADTIMTPSPTQIPIRNAIACHDQRWQWGKSTFTMVSPNNDDHSSNHHSCVLQIIVGNHRILLPGDIGVRKQNQLAVKLADKSYRTMLIAPNQTPRYTPSPTFLKALHPDTVLFSGGQSLKVPVPASWTTTGSRLLSTTDCGAITITLQPNQPRKVQCYRQEHRQYWNYIPE